MESARSVRNGVGACGGSPHWTMAVKPFPHPSPSNSIPPSPSRHLLLVSPSCIPFRLSRPSSYLINNQKHLHNLPSSTITNPRLNIIILNPAFLLFSVPFSCGVRGLSTYLIGVEARMDPQRVGRVLSCFGLSSSLFSFLLSRPFSLTSFLVLPLPPGSICWTLSSPNVFLLPSSLCPDLPLYPSHPLPSPPFSVSYTLGVCTVC